MRQPVHKYGSSTRNARNSFSPCSLPTLVLEKMAHEMMNCGDLFHLCNQNKECQAACTQVFGLESWTPKQMLWTCCMHKINRLLRNDDFEPKWWQWKKYDPKEFDIATSWSKPSIYKKDPPSVTHPRQIGVLAEIVLYPTNKGKFNVYSTFKLQDLVSTFERIFPFTIRPIDTYKFEFEYDDETPMRSLSQSFCNELNIKENVIHLNSGITYWLFEEVTMGHIHTDMKNDSLRDVIIKENVLTKYHDHFYDYEKNIRVASKPINIRVDLLLLEKESKLKIHIPNPTLNQLVRQVFQLKGCSWKGWNDRDPTDTRKFYVTLPALSENESRRLFILNNFPFLVSSGITMHDSYMDGMTDQLLPYDPSSKFGFHVKKGY